MQKKVIASPLAPKAVGPYSQAIAAGTTLYVSGQLPIDAATGLMAEGIEAWWDKVAILKNSGCDGIQGYVFSKPLDPAEIATIYSHNLLIKPPQ